MEPHSFYYSTRRLLVLFDCNNNKINCTIYNIQGKEWRVLQTMTIKRPGLSKLKNTHTPCRALLKTMRHRMSKALSATLAQ